MELQQTLHRPAPLEGLPGVPGQEAEQTDGAQGGDAEHLYCGRVAAAPQPRARLEARHHRGSAIASVSANPLLTASSHAGFMTVDQACLLCSNLRNSVSFEVCLVKKCVALKEGPKISKQWYGNHDGRSSMPCSNLRNSISFVDCLVKNYASHVSHRRGSGTWQWRRQSSWRPRRGPCGSPVPPCQARGTLGRLREDTEHLTEQSNAAFRMVKGGRGAGRGRTAGISRWPPAGASSRTGCRSPPGGTRSAPPLRAKRPLSCSSTAPPGLRTAALRGAPMRLNPETHRTCRVASTPATCWFHAIDDACTCDSQHLRRANMEHYIKCC